MKKKFPEVLRYGIKLALILVVAAGLIGIVSKYRNRKSGQHPAVNTDSAVSAGYFVPVLCDGLDKPLISSGSPEVSQMVMRGCFSPVAVARSLPKNRIEWRAPGEVFICLRLGNHCVALLHAARGDKPLHKLRGEVPDDYEEILFKGDPGVVHLKLR